MIRVTDHFSADHGIAVLDRRISDLLEYPLTSFWLRRALTGALVRDVLDAARDGEILATILKNRHDAHLSDITGKRHRWRED